MHDPNVTEVLNRIKPGQLVLDVGGWACPFNRANWVLDQGDFESRGAIYEKQGLPRSQGGKEEFFSPETWVRRDICAKEPWPFQDKFFDYSICSHTLEDIRDPLFVCHELIRVSKAGYIEIPSREAESSRGWEHPRLAGLSHHRWLIDIHDNHIQFTMKYHMIHSEFWLSFPSSFLLSMPQGKKITSLFWKNSFTFSEAQIHGLENIRENLTKYVTNKHQYPRYRYWLHSLGQLKDRLKNKLGSKFQ